MNKAFRIPLLILFLSSLGCSKVEFYDIDPELQPYYDAFVKSAQDRDIVLTPEQLDVTMNFADILDPNVLGQCSKRSSKYGAVTIDRYHWGVSDETTRSFLIYHELGHCVLDRGHQDGIDSDGNCESLMHSYVGLCSFDFTGMTKEAYIDELFSQ